MDYGFNQPLGLPGGIFDLSGKKIVTRITDPGVEVTPGMGLVRGATEGETVKAAGEGATKDTFEGVFVHGSKNLEHDMKGNVATNGGDSIGLMQKGRIWAQVVSTAKVAYGAGVSLIIGGENSGKFTDTTDEKETSKVTIDAKFTGKVDLDNLIAVIEM
jgi:hypothetical protein